MQWNKESQSKISVSRRLDGSKNRLDPNGVVQISYQRFAVASEDGLGNRPFNVGEPRPTKISTSEASGYNRGWTFVPKGHARLAQRFNVG